MALGSSRYHLAVPLKSIERIDTRDASGEYGIVSIKYHEWNKHRDFSQYRIPRSAVLNDIVHGRSEEGARGGRLLPPPETGEK